MFNKIITAIICFFAVSVPLLAATAPNVKDIKGLGANVSTALQYPADAASGVPRLDASAKLKEAQLPTSVIPVSGTPAADNLFGYDGSNAVPIALGENLSIASGTLNATGGTGAAISGTPATDSMAKFVSASAVGAATRGVDYAAPSYTWNVPAMILPTATISDAAATVTLSATLPATYAGMWVYVQANQLKAVIAAAWHWFVGSSTTVGKICQETYDPATQVPYVPASCTEFTDAVPGTITGLTGSYVVYAQITKPAGALGNNGYVWGEAYRRDVSSATNKYVQFSYGTATAAQTQTTVTRSVQKFVIQNRGVANKQSGYSSTGTGSIADIAETAVDDASAQTISWSLRLGAESDIGITNTLSLGYSGAPE